MERLSFADAGVYDGLEASIHLARYALVRELCSGKVVLDMACGEGYGASLMGAWGARSVAGVDVSNDAIAQAQRLFEKGAVEFRMGSAESVATMFLPGSFDLIVSLETIEHVKDPAAMLESFKRLLAPGGVIVISCPNDWWYYPNPGESNPFHLRKYTFEEFKLESESILGPSRAWYFGGPMAGFCNTKLDEFIEVGPDKSQAVMLRPADVKVAMALPSEAGAGPRSTSSSYFVGVWSDCEQVALPVVLGATMLPVSMNAFKDGFFAEAANTNRELRQQIENLQERFTELERTGVWKLDDSSMSYQLDRAERLRKSLDLTNFDGPAKGLAEKTKRYLNFLNRIADIEKSSLLTQLQRLKVLYESQAELVEQVRVTRQKLENERASARGQRESLAIALNLTREAQEDLAVAKCSGLELRQELEMQRERFNELSLHANSLQLLANRYLALRKFVPAKLRRLFMLIVRRGRRLVAAVK